jgi:parallel beta-helix repeat protein
VTNPSQGIYRPEAYGVPDGATPATDMPLVQAALDAVTAAGGGTVRLDQTYALGYTAGHDLTQSVGPYSISYGVWLNSSNVVVDGNGTGVFVIPANPVGMAHPYVAFLAGNGGYSLSVEGSYPGWAWLMANDAGNANVTLKDFSFDCSALSDADLLALTTGALSSVLAMCHNLDSTIDGITIDRGFGSTGAISIHCSSLRCDCKNCTVTLAYNRAFHFDGPEAGTFSNLVVGGMIVDTQTNLGIATNTDYQHDSLDCIIDSCNLSGGLYGIAIGGSGNSIINNTVNLPSDTSITRYGIVVAVNTLTADWPASNVTITGNTIDRPGGGVKGWGILLQGQTVSPNTGLPITVEACDIESNTLGAGLAIGIRFDQEAKNNTFIHNTNNAQTNTSLHVTATGNVTSPNP